MKKTTLFIVILATIIGCKTRPDLSSQLKANLSSRLLKFDSSVVIDSFKVIEVDTLNQRFGVVIEDTIYLRQFHSIQQQLAHALTRSYKDSIEYFQGEINYMSGQIDSLTKSIKTSDTTHKYGIFAKCYYQISKNGKNKQDSIYYFIDRAGNILNSEMLDTLLAMSNRSLR